jgi:hypothetical protein
MKALTIILLTILAYSCTCERKLDKVLKKCPELLVNDTIKIRDTIVINGVQKDTVFNYLVKDTVIIREGGLTMKYFYNTHDSTIYLSGKCDTIYIPYTKDIPVNQILNEDSKGFNWWMVCAIGLAILLIFLIVKSK